jgi:prophage DNA circulation protein
MGSPLKERHPASFRGVRFLSPKNTTEEGRNGIQHDYPQSSRRYVQDNGLILPCFKLPAVVQGKAKLNALRIALNRPGPGTLIHPDFGAQRVQVKGPYSITHEDTNLGVFTLEIEFAVTGKATGATSVGAIAASIPGLSRSAINAVIGSARLAWIAPSSAKSISVISGAVTGVLHSTLLSFGNVSTIRSAIGLTKSDVESAVISPGRLWGTFETLFSAPMADFGTSQDRLYDGYNRLWGQSRSIRSSALATLPTTLNLASRRIDLEVLSEVTATCCLAAMCEAAVGRSYATQEAVSEVQGQITGIYEEIASGDQTRLSDEAYSALTEVHVQTMDVLAAVEVQLPEIVNLDVIDMPASVLAYMLYEADSRAETLLDLNSRQTATLMTGSVKVLRHVL